MIIVYPIVNEFPFIVVHPFPSSRSYYYDHGFYYYCRFLGVKNSFANCEANRNNSILWL